MGMLVEPERNKVVFHTLRSIAEAREIEEAWTLTVEALKRYGFERVNYGLTRSKVGSNIGDPGDALFLSTHAIDAVRAHHENGTYRHMPEYRWVIENTGACSWGWIEAEREAGQLSDGELAALEQFAAKRKRAGYSISFPDGNDRCKGAMGMAAPRGVSQDIVDALWQRVGDEVLALCNMMHFRICQLPLRVPNVALTSRQREVLEWLADGKSMQDICILTGLSLSSVEKHLRKGRDALGVETTAQAVAKASFLNQIFIGENHANAAS
jgi:DNA-binding CsgD family transcriptional regulator